MLGIPFEDIIIVMATATALLTVLAVWLAFLPKDNTAARARALIDRREALKAAAGGRKHRAKSVKAVGLMRTIVTRLKLLSSKHAESCALKLSGAGYRSNDAMIAFLFAKVAGPLGLGLLAAVLIYWMEVVDWAPFMKIAATMGAAILGSYLPDLYVSNALQKRQKQLQKALPDGLDLMVICAEAGLSLDATLQRVSRELGRTWPELADEFSLTAVEIGFMPDRRQALENLSGRCFLPGIRAMVNTLSQTEKYGTPLSESLRVLSAELRTERMLRAEEKAARLPATLTVPMILFILPPLFVVLIGPAILSVGDAMSSVV
jgi:tight adherence protein C